MNDTTTNNFSFYVTGDKQALSEYIKILEDISGFTGIDYAANLLKTNHFINFSVQSTDRLVFKQQMALLQYRLNQDKRLNSERSFYPKELGVEWYLSNFDFRYLVKDIACFLYFFLLGAFALTSAVPYAENSEPVEKTSFLSLTAHFAISTSLLYLAITTSYLYFAIPAGILGGLMLFLVTMFGIEDTSYLFVSNTLAWFLSIIVLIQSIAILVLIYSPLVALLSVASISFIIICYRAYIQPFRIGNKQ